MFADVSERAYTASVYVGFFSDNVISVYLVVAKTKVTPLKTVSIPRFELCVACLLISLLNVVKDALDLKPA